MARSLLLLAFCIACAWASFVVEFTVQLESAKETFEVTVHPEWAPLGAARFKELADSDFFNSIRFFRTISGFMTQFGIPGLSGGTRRSSTTRLLAQTSVGFSLLQHRARTVARRK